MNENEEIILHKTEGRTRGERRKQDWAKALRKQRLCPWWYKVSHKYSKGKIHCSCPMCASKTRSTTTKKTGSAENWVISDQKKIEDMKEQIQEETWK